MPNKIAIEFLTTKELPEAMSSGLDLPRQSASSFSTKSLADQYPNVLTTTMSEEQRKFLTKRLLVERTNRIDAAIDIIPMQLMTKDEPQVIHMQPTIKVQGSDSCQTISLP